MILNFRSKRGVASKYVPESAELNIKKLLKGQASGKEKTNRRSAQPNN